MRPENIPYDQLERFLRKEMPEEEALVFEAELTRQPAWQEALAMERDIQALPKSMEVNAAIAAAGKVYFSKESPKSQPLYRWLAVAAVVLLLAALSWLFLLPQPSQQELITEADLRPYPLYQNLRSEPDSSDKLWIAYQSQDYSSFLNGMNNLEDSVKKTPPYLFYTGQAHIALGKWDQAQLALEAVLASPTPTLFDQQSNWYLAIVYLKQDQKEKAIPLLQEIAKTENSYTSTSNRLLDLLN